MAATAASTGASLQPVPATVSTVCPKSIRGKGSKQFTMKQCVSVVVVRGVVTVMAKGEGDSGSEGDGDGDGEG